MTYQRFKTLLSQYLSDNISKNDFGELKRISQKMSDPQIEEAIGELWQNYDNSSIAKFKERNLSVPKLIMPKSSWRVGLSRVAAVLFIPLMLLSIYLVYDTNKATPSQMAIIETANGERAKITLPDGSVIHLNNATKIEYGNDFGVEHRKVTLSGEAFFDVFKNDGKEFIVQTNHAKVVVTGTKFNVSAYDSNNYTEASLIEGTIEISSINNPTKRVKLNPNQKAVVDNATGNIIKSTSEMIYETAWRQNELIFRSANLDDVFQKLEVFYGQSIDINGKTGKTSDKLFTGRFKEEKMTDVMKILQLHYKFKYIVKDGDIIVTFN